MIDKRFDRNYKYSHQKNAKREVKHLTRRTVPDTIFSNKQQATSNKQQATSNKQQSGISAQSAQCTQNTHKFPQLITRTGQEHCLRAFFILHRLRKPQRTQSLELRSTSQRNNRNVIQIGIGQSKKTLNLPGFQRVEPFGRRKKKEQKKYQLNKELFYENK